MVTGIWEHQQSLLYPSFRANLHSRDVLQFTVNPCIDLISCFHLFICHVTLMWLWASWRQSHVLFVFVWPMYARPIVGLKVAANFLTSPTKRCNLFLLLLNLGWPMTAVSNGVEWKWHYASSKPSPKENLVSPSHEGSHTKSSYPTGESMWGSMEREMSPMEPSLPAEPAKISDKYMAPFWTIQVRSATICLSQRTPVDST